MADTTARHPLRAEAADTGGWQHWRTVPANMSPTTGVHQLYLTFTSHQAADFVNLNRLTPWWGGTRALSRREE